MTENSHVHVESRHNARTDRSTGQKCGRGPLASSSPHAVFANAVQQQVCGDLAVGVFRSAAVRSAGTNGVVVVCGDGRTARSRGQNITQTPYRRVPGACMLCW